MSVGDVSCGGAPRPTFAVRPLLCTCAPDVANCACAVVFCACRMGLIAGDEPLTAACSRGSIVVSAGGPCPGVGIVGCDTAPGKFAPGAVPLDVVLDCGSVPVATVASGALVIWD